MGSYDKISSLHRGSHPYLSRGKKEGQEGWVWDGMWNIYLKVPEEGHLLSNTIVAEFRRPLVHWQLYFHDIVQTCWKFLSPDHLAWRCQAKPRPKSYINWVPYCGAHVGVANSITEEEMEDTDFDYQEVASQRSQEETDRGKSDVMLSGNKKSNLKEKVVGQEKTIQKLIKELAEKVARLQEMLKVMMEEWAGKEAQMRAESEQRDKLIQMLTENLKKAQEESSKRARVDSVEESSQSKSLKLSEEVNGFPEVVQVLPEGGIQERPSGRTIWDQLNEMSDEDAGKK